jgi:hypothetical protein
MVFGIVYVSRSGMRLLSLALLRSLGLQLSFRCYDILGPIPDMAARPIGDTVVFRIEVETFQVLLHRLQLDS